MEFSVKNCCCFAQYLLLCCKRPVMRRMAMLGPALLYGLYSMAWTVVAGWRWFSDIAGGWLTGIEVICTWHLGRSSVVVRVRRSVKSSAHGRRWLTQAQLTRSESSEHHDVLGREYPGVSCRCLGQEGELAWMCLVSALVIQSVILCSVLTLSRPGFFCSCSQGGKLCPLLKTMFLLY